MNEPSRKLLAFGLLAALLLAGLVRLPVAYADELDEAFASAVRQRVEALVLFPDPINVGARSRVAALAIKHKLPTVYDLSFFAFEGGLLSYGPHWEEFAPRVYASCVDKILRGADPAELPIQQPTRLELVINLRTARALGLNVPQSLLARADRVIE